MSVGTAWHGPAALAALLVSVDALVLDPANARRHGEANLEAIKGSLARFGQQKPIVIDANGVVRAGNGTLEAARSLGWTELAAVRSDLIGSEATAYAIADNRTAELAEWDPEILAEQVSALEAEGIPAGVLGFTPEELAELTHGTGDDDEPDGDERSDGSLLDLVQVTLDDPAHAVQRGEVWRLGDRHLLVCACVLTEWAAYVPFLQPGAHLMPYAGPFLALSLGAQEHAYVLVQPDPYIAGHVLDQYAAIHGEGSVSRG